METIYGLIILIIVVGLPIVGFIAISKELGKRRRAAWDKLSPDGKEVKVANFFFVLVPMAIYLGLRRDFGDINALIISLTLGAFLKVILSFLQNRFKLRGDGVFPKKPDISKICPFCKKPIESFAAECPFCKMVVAESVGRPSGTKIVNQKVHHTNIFSRISLIVAEEMRGVKEAIKTAGCSRQGVVAFFRKHRFTFTVAILVLLGLGSLYNGTSKSDSPSPGPLISDTSKPIRYLSLPNGMVFNSLIRASNDPGRLTINNGTDYDAVVKLVNTGFGISAYSVYIQAKSDYTITGIPNANYDLYFQTGKDWDDKQGRFAVSPSFSKFRERFTYTTTDTEDYDGISTSYSVYTVTLNPVIGGTAKTDKVAEAEFAKY